MASQHKTGFVKLGTAVTVAVTLLSTLAPAASASVRVSNSRTGAVVVAGNTWRNVPYVTANNTTYFGIWYLQQLLRAYGVTADWDGRALRITGLPAVYSAGTTLNEQRIGPGQTLDYNGSHYVNVTALAASLGGQATFSNPSQSLNLSLPALTTTSGSVGVTQAPGSSIHTVAANASTTAVVKATSSTAPASTVTGGVYDNGRLWRTVPVIRQGGTTFFGVWYLQELLRSHGIQSGWDGSALSIDSLPQVVQSAAFTSGNVQLTATLIQFGQEWYAPVSCLQASGIQAQVDGAHTVALTIAGIDARSNVTGQLVDASGTPVRGRIAMEDMDGNVSVIDTNADGSYQTTLPTLGGTVIGSETEDNGWVTQSDSFSGLTPQVKASETQAFSTIHGQLRFTGQKYPISIVSVRNMITHAHYYAPVSASGSFSMKVPSGAYEVYGLVTGTQVVLLAQPFTTTGDTTSLVVSASALPTSGRVTTAHAIVIASDKAVTGADLASVANLFEHVYTSTVSDTGIKVSDTSKITITLYGSASSYAKHFTAEGYSSTDAQQIADGSVAVAEGPNSIGVLMPAYNAVDGMNILAHEFTHTLIAHVSNQIDSWANEGIAWHEGVRAGVDGSPDSTLLQSTQWAQWIDIVAHQQQGDLLPLGDPNPLDGNYNIEAQDYFAVQQLIDQFGLDKYMSYIKKIDTDANAFQDTFGETFDQFSAQVTTKLSSLASQPDAGFVVRLKALPGGPGKVYVMNPNGTVQWIQGLQAGQVYSIVCHPDGTVTLPPGLTSVSGPALDALSDGDWYVGCGGDGTADRQEFNFVNQFGTPFLAFAVLYGSDRTPQYGHLATAVPNGLQIVDVKPDNNQ